MIGSRWRLRCTLWTQWKMRRKGFSELQHLGIDEKPIYVAIMSPKGVWRLSASEALHRALHNRFFKHQNLVL